VNPLHVFAAMFVGWFHNEQHTVIAYLREENRVLKSELGLDPHPGGVEESGASRGAVDHCHDPHGAGHPAER
jgi:hypothetical protein